jgi:hypothetical protein
MPIFYVEPKDGDTSDPSWATTYIHEGVWLSAHDPDHARMIMQGSTLKMTDVHPGKKILTSPWLNGHLTICKADSLPRAIPKGKILTKSGKLIDV